MLANVEVGVDGCLPAGVRGSINNNNDSAIEPTIEVNFYSQDGTLQISLADRPTIAARGSGTWSVPQLPVDELEALARYGGTPEEAAEEILARISGYVRCEVVLTGLTGERYWAGPRFPDRILHVGPVQSE